MLIWILLAWTLLYAPYWSPARDLIARHPGFATTHQWHATNLLNAGRVEEAITSYEAALALDPRARVIHQNLGILLTARGRFEEADEVLRNLETFAPDYWDGAQARFLLYLVSGRREAAEREGEHLVRILGRTRSTVPLYLDLFFAPERRAAAVAEILAFPRDQWWVPENPSLVEVYAVPFLLAAAGAHDEALELMRWGVAHDGDYYSPALARAGTVTGGFACLPEVRAFFAELGLPPLADEPKCP